MRFESKIFNNRELNKTKKFPASRDLFYDKSEEIFNHWTKYLQAYAGQTRAIFQTDKPELPWFKFDEEAWVSSIAIAIAKKSPNALLIEELPVSKKAGSSNGNADLWCSLDATNKEKSFSFYLEAKISSKKKRMLSKGTLKESSLEEAGAILTASNKNSLLSVSIRDYLKSAGGTNISPRSPHALEKNRKHKHTFLVLVLLPMQWNQEKWPKKVSFRAIFNKKIAQFTSQKNPAETSKVISRSLHNIPITGMVMRESDKSTGFIALMMMLGASSDKGRK